MNFQTSVIVALGFLTASGIFAAEHVYTAPPLSFYEKKFPWTVPKSLSDKQTASHQGSPDWNADEEKVRAVTLPDLFTLADGTSVSTAAQWTQRRRPELLRLFQREVFGVAPPRPADLTFRVVETDPGALGGKATRKKVELRFTVGGEPYAFHVHLFVPNQRSTPVPVFLQLNHRGAGAPDPVALTTTGYFPAEYVINRGYAIGVVFTAAEVDPDKANADTGIRAFYKRHHDQPDTFTWGTLAAWAWSGSRALDYFETDPDLDAKRVALVGQSRGGKTALWGGANDERFALVCCNCAGEGGPALARRNFGETLGQITRAFPHWFTPTYAAYANKIDQLPIDAHELIALVAPRAYHGVDASEDLHSDPRGSWLALVEASKVWSLLGHGQPWKDQMPLVNDLCMDGPLAYHMRAGEHDLKLFDWKLYLDHADTLFRK